MRALAEIITQNTVAVPSWALDRPRPKPEPWTVESLAVAWREGEHNPHHPAWRAYVAQLKVVGKELERGITLLPSWQTEPYADSATLRRTVCQCSSLLVANDNGLVFAPGHPLAEMWDQRETGLTLNGLSRAVHDYYGHVLAENDFSFLGEYGAYKAESAQFDAAALPALFAEVVGQAAYHEVYGTFPPVQKCVVLDPKRGIVL